MDMEIIFSNITDMFGCVGSNKVLNGVVILISLISAVVTVFYFVRNKISESLNHLMLIDEEYGGNNEKVLKKSYFLNVTLIDNLVSDGNIVTALDISPQVEIVN